MHGFQVASVSDRPTPAGRGPEITAAKLPFKICDKIKLTMSDIPNIHDHSLLEYRVDLANRRITFFTLPEQARSQLNTKPLLTVFEGREGHHFDKVSSGVIFLDIEEASLSEFLKDHESELDEGSKSVGAPPWWGGSLEKAHAYLAGRNVRAFEINSSYGFSGWVLATKVRRLA
jgi:hypothetical protein